MKCLVKLDKSNFFKVSGFIKPPFSVLRVCHHIYTYFLNHPYSRVICLAIYETLEV